MSQNDFTIDNQTAPAFRADLNLALQALASLSSGGIAPTTTFANMLWYDTTEDKLKMRNESDSAWITLGTLDQSTNKFLPAGVGEDSVFVLTGTTPSLATSNGTIQTHLLTGNTTYSDGLSSGQSLTLMIDDGTDYTVTWDVVDQWAGGFAPSLSPTGYTTISIWKVGTTVYGALVGYMS